MIKIVHANLLSFPADVIVQQNNCLAVKSHGLSKSIADKFPYADVYGQRKSVTQPSSTSSSSLSPMSSTSRKRNLSRPEDRPEPGTIQLCWPTKECVHPFFKKLVKVKETKTEIHTPVVVCLFAQYEMGKPGAYHMVRGEDGKDSEGKETKERVDYRDSSENRLAWFKKCLAKLLQQLPSICTRLKKSAKDSLVVAFPYKVGCGLAGGDWKLYKRALEVYSEQAAKLSCCVVTTVVCVVSE